MKEFHFPLQIHQEILLMCYLTWQLQYDTTYHYQVLLYYLQPIPNYLVHHNYKINKVESWVAGKDVHVSNYATWLRISYRSKLLSMLFKRVVAMHRDESKGMGRSTTK